MPDTTPYYKSKPSIAGKLLNNIAGAKTGGTMYFIRHGSTDMNSDDRIRGWLNPALNKEGLAEAHKIADKLKGKGISCIITSDLQRAKKTADIISDTLNIPIDEVTKSLRPWDLGNLAGQSATKVQPEIMRYVTNMPNTVVPGGESFNSFRKRYINFIRSLVKEYAGQTIAVVAHFRNERLLQAWVKDGDPDNLDIEKGEFGKDGIEPAEYLVIPFSKLK